MPSWLIPLDKCPGVRPIGVGEVPRRIIAKAILRTIGKDIEEAAGPLQCAQVRMAVAKLQSMLCGLDFNMLTLKGALLVDASMPLIP